ncbi:MAG: hypothetical protein MSA07_01110 [Mucispirillum sp.]|nr:hypothetical protein [Mucispirillum sp.]
MKKSYILGAALSLLVLIILIVYITQTIQPKYKPNTREALILLVNNNVKSKNDCNTLSSRLSSRKKYL